MVIVARLTRVLLVLLLALVTVALVAALLASGRGPVERVVLLALVVGCLYLAMRISALTGWAEQRFGRR